MQNTKTAGRRRTFPGCWGMRLFGLLLFLYGVHYCPVHLALEPHVGDLHSSSPGESAHHDGLFAPGHDADSDHAPHLASDHSLRLTSQAQLGGVVTAACVASAALEVPRPLQILRLFQTERHNPPGIPPPEPLRPRSPPLV